MVKSEVVFLQEPCSSNRKALDELLEKRIIEEIEDDIYPMTIISGSKNFGLPFNATAEGLIKRQNDRVSGNVAFSQTVSIL